MKYILSIAVLVLSATTYHQVYAQTFCHEYAKNNYSQIDSRFGLPFSFFTTNRDLLVSVRCKSSGAEVIAGGLKDTIVFEKGYLLKNGQWQPFDFEGNQKTGIWYFDEVKADIEQSAGIIIAYTCTKVGIAWKCGCRNSSCTGAAGKKWQIQKFVGVPIAPADPEVLVNYEQTTESGNTSSKVPPGYRVNFYGNPHIMSSLGNTTISTLGTGSTGGTGYSNRVIFPFSGKVVGVRKYHIWTDTPRGYHLGDGGTVEYRMETDDGTNNHWPSGKILGRTGDVIGAPEIFSGNRSGLIDTPYPGDDDNFRRFDFESPVSVKAGEIYHLTVWNTSDNPRERAVAMDDFLSYNPDNRAAVIDPLNWGVLSESGGKWEYRPRHTMITEFYFEDGRAWGVGNMEVANPTDDFGYRLEGTLKVRERFVVSGGDRRANKLIVGAVRESGSAGIDVVITGPQGRVYTGTIPANKYPVKGKQSFIPGASTRGSVAFDKSITLKNGSEYTVELSTKSGTVYGVAGIRDGSHSYRFDEATTFSDGIAEVDVHGNGSWTGWFNYARRPVDEVDVNLYFELD